MKDILELLADKYDGKYLKEREKIVYAAEGKIHFKESQAMFVIEGYRVRLISNEDGVSGLPYKVIVTLQKFSSAKFYIYPRSYFERIIRQIGFNRIENRYRSNLNKQLLQITSDDYILESLLINHNVSILKKEKGDESELIISPIESVLNIETMVELIEIGIRLSKIIDKDL